MELVVENLAVRRGARLIINKLDFSLESSEALIVTGKNGSGKSTLLRALAGLLPLASGALSFSSSNEGSNEDERQKTDEAENFGELCHFLGHKNAMKDALSVRENLIFWRDFHGSPWLTPEEALEKLGLEHANDLPFGYLSNGQKRRAAIARLLVSKKPAWIVDEPTAALDTASSDLFSKLVDEYCADGGMVIAATHLSLKPGLPPKKIKKLKLEPLDAGTQLQDEFWEEIPGEEF